MSGKRGSVLRIVNGGDADDEKVVTPVKKLKAIDASSVTPEAVKSSHAAAMKELAGSVRSSKEV